MMRKKKRFKIAKKEEEKFNIKKGTKKKREKQLHCLAGILILWPKPTKKRSFADLEKTKR